LAANLKLLDVPGEYYNGMVIVDPFSIFFNFLFLIIAGLALLSLQPVDPVPQPVVLQSQSAALAG
jgi:hypothetical protein